MQHHKAPPARLARPLARGLVLGALLVASTAALVLTPMPSLQAADGPAAAKTSAQFTPEQEKEIGRIVRDYLLANPDVLVEVSTELDNRRKAEDEESRTKVLSEQKEQIFRSQHDFVLGNPDAKITVVEFFDYNCGWCKRALNEINLLIASDPNIRFVMKEFPIFGEHSEFAARAALAARKQDKYWEFHQALMKEKRVTTDNTLEIAKRVGIDVEALKREMANPVYGHVLKENHELAQALGMQGTPGFIIDSRVNYGYLPADGIREIVADIRKEGCKIC